MTLLSPVLARRTTLTRAGLDQKDAILAFQRSAITSIPEDYYDLQAKAAWWRTPAMGLDALIASGRYFVTAIDGKLVAGAGWEPYRDGESAMLRAVFVDPRFSGLGLGQRIVRQVEADAMRKRRSHMVVPAALNAVGFYEKLGYARVARASAEVEPGLKLDYQVMEKSLAGV